MSATSAIHSERVSITISIERTTCCPGTGASHTRRFDRAFTTADANRDGAIDKLELSDLYERAAARAGRPVGLSVDDTITALDVDGDSVISRQEFDAGVEALGYGAALAKTEIRVIRSVTDVAWRRHENGGGRSRAFERLFTRLDANGDGGIDADEIGAELARISARTGGANVPSVEQVLAKLDTDDSGAVQRPELRSALDRVRRAAPASCEPGGPCTTPPAVPEVPSAPPPDKPVISCEPSQTGKVVVSCETHVTTVAVSSYEAVERLPAQPVEPRVDARG